MVNGREKIGVKTGPDGQLQHEVQMSERQVMEYIQSLLKGEHPDLSRTERDVLEMFRKASQEAGALRQRLQRVEQDRATLADKIKNLAGQCDGYAKLLVMMKQQRDAEQIRKQFREDEKKLSKG